MNIKIKMDRGAFFPKYQTSGASGFDIHAKIDIPIGIKPGKIALIPTGIYFKIPKGYEIQIRSRSGLALKNGIIVLNSPGTIDSDYTGELKIILMNVGLELFKINKGDRIAQAILSKVFIANFIEVDRLPITDRNSKGFGHTGK